jgi:membrane glycosyltransferase
VIWDAQNRDDRSITLMEALHGLWPQLTFGLAAITILGLFMPPAIIWAGLTIIPCLLAVPFACVTSMRWLGQGLSAVRLCAIPDEFDMAWEIGGPGPRPILTGPPLDAAGLQPAPVDA